MNRDLIEGLLKQAKGSIKEHWGLLTSDRLAVVAGRCEQLAGLAQVRRGGEKERSDCEIREFMRRNREWNTSSRQ